MQTRATYQKSLTDLQGEVVTLGGMVATAIDRSIEALNNRDLALAREVIADDKKINEKRFAIEQRATETIATQQPMAGDLRAIISMLHIITDLERMGDHADGNARVVVLIGDEPPLKPLIDVPLMAKKGIEMLNSSLLAFVNRDMDLALRVAAQDDEIDALYDRVFNDLIGYMVADPSTITRATRLIWVGHNLERIADRVTNICERVVYCVTGLMQEIGASKY